MKSQKGFTLVELMIVVVIVGILAAIAVPSYRQHVIKSNRAAAEGFMMAVANKQEQYMLDARQYATTVAMLSLAAPAEVTKNYAVDVVASNTTTPPSYVVRATPNNAGVDPTCGTIGLDSTGLKGTTTAAVSPVVTAAPSCW